LLDPAGNIIKFNSMNQWCRDHEIEFSLAASRIYSKFAYMSRCLKVGRPQKPLCGWTLYKPPEFIKKAED